MTPDKSHVVDWISRRCIHCHKEDYDCTNQCEMNPKYLEANLKQLVRINQIKLEQLQEIIRLEREILEKQTLLARLKSEL